eukprot:gene9087-50201_t
MELHPIEQLLTCCGSVEVARPISFLVAITHHSITPHHEATAIFRPAAESAQAEADHVPAQQSALERLCSVADERAVRFLYEEERKALERIASAR